MRALDAASGLGAAADREARDFPPTLPAGLARVLATALASEGLSSRAAILRQHYLVDLPRARQEQLAAGDLFFDTPLDWAQLPRLSGAIDRLFALLAQVGAPARVLGCDSAAALRATATTLGALYPRTHYGAHMPLLYGYPADLAWFARALDGAPFHAVFDRHLAAPVIHELMHFSPEREPLYPLHVDECVAGWLGVHLLPEFAYPRPGEDGAIFAAPWFAQVGQALARTVGLAPLTRAHVGVVPWREALSPALVDALGRLGWEDWLANRQLHFLSDNRRPERWMKLFFLAAARQPIDRLSFEDLDALSWREVPPGDEAPADRALLGDGLRAMCLRNRVVDRHFVVSSEPAHAPVEINLAECRVTTAPGADGHDLAAPAYLFPPALAARLRSGGLARLRLLDLDPIDAEALAGALISGDLSKFVQIPM